MSSSSGSSRGGGGLGAQLVAWDDDLVEVLAGRGFHVIRYDNRDTGRSTSYPPGQPGYRYSDFAADAVGILDALNIERAHVVGLSLGGMTAQALAD